MFPVRAKVSDSVTTENRDNSLDSVSLCFSGLLLRTMKQKAICSRSYKTHCLFSPSHCWINVCCESKKTKLLKAYSDIL